MTPFGGGTYNVYQNDCCIGDFYFPEDTFTGTCAGNSCSILMDTVCRITTNADAAPNTQIDVHALFQHDNADQHIYNNGLRFNRANNSLYHNGADTLVAGIYEYRYSFNNGPSGTDRGGYLATITVQDGLPEWVNDGPLTAN